MIFLIIACVLLAAACVGLVLHIIRLRKNMDTVRKELGLTMARGYNRQITVDLIDDSLSEMTVQINKNLEHQKMLKEKAEVAEKNLKLAVSDIAHDLRTPLTVISGNLQLLKSEENISRRGMEYIELSEEKCAAMKNMADDFFELSVLESDTSPTELSRVNMTNTLMQFVADNEAVIRMNKLNPEILFPERTVFAMAEESYLLRILGNLLNNVVKYAQDSFTLSLSETENGCSVTFSNRVGDDRYIDTEKLFERTYRADKSRSGNGAGLGLYIVKLLAEKQGATVFATLSDGILSIGVNFSK